MTAKTTLRIDSGMLMELQSAAKADGRSVNQQVLYYIRRALDAKQNVDGSALRRDGIEEVTQN